MAVEGILVDGAFRILENLIAVIDNQISLAWGVEDELKKLKQTLEVIAAKTSDAESKQVNDAEVTLCLKRLKEAAYDADDILDEFSYEAMGQSEKSRSKVIAFLSSSNQVAFRFKMARQIKDINKKLNQIATDMERFQFQTTSTNSTTNQYEQFNRQPLSTSFFGDVLKFVGREKDKSKIVTMLISSSISSPSSSSVNLNQHESVSVISIVGMGGLGKTTLAQSIYKHKSVEDQFMTRMWISVSDDFDVSKILRNIMESITYFECTKYSNIDVLAKEVREKLEGTKYLLVLDDFWSDDPTEWNKLKSVLDSGSVGSKVIVITRNRKVASMVQGLIPPYELDVLSEGECWSIIKKKVFSPGGASETLNMKTIGKQIAKNVEACHLLQFFWLSYALTQR